MKTIWMSLCFTMLSVSNLAIAEVGGVARRYEVRERVFAQDGSAHYGLCLADDKEILPVASCPQFLELAKLPLEELKAKMFLSPPFEKLRIRETQAGNRKTAALNSIKLRNKAKLETEAEISRLQKRLLGTDLTPQDRKLLTDRLNQEEKRLADLKKSVLESEGQVQAIDTVELPRIRAEVKSLQDRVSIVFAEISATEMPSVYEQDESSYDMLFSVFHRGRLKLKTLESSFEVSYYDSFSYQFDKKGNERLFSALAYLFIYATGSQSGRLMYLSYKAEHVGDFEARVIRSSYFVLKYSREPDGLLRGTGVTRERVSYSDIDTGISLQMRNKDSSDRYRYRIHSVEFGLEAETSASQP